MSNLLAQLRKRDRGGVMVALKDVYSAPDRLQAQARLRGLADRLRDDYPQLADWLEEEAVDTLSIFDFPVTPSADTVDERSGAFEPGDSPSDKGDPHLS